MQESNLPTKANKEILDSEEEDVFYCENCFSLKILEINENNSYCGCCGNTEIKKTSFANWEDIYKLEYNKAFLKK